MEPKTVRLQVALGIGLSLCVLVGLIALIMVLSGPAAGVQSPVAVDWGSGGSAPCGPMVPGGKCSRSVITVAVDWGSGSCVPGTPGCGKPKFAPMREISLESLETIG